jgi:TonB-dependent receptor
MKITSILCRQRVSRIVMVMLLATFGQFALAQASGSVSGRVADQNGASLPGAQVSIPSLGLQTSTNPQGEFTLNGVAAGSHAIQVNYLGHQPMSQTVTVSAGQRSVLNYALVPAGIEELVVVGSAIRDATARALNQQRMADNTGNVISADSIGKFPDPNIAEALQRTAGIAIERDQGEGRYINVRGAPSEFSAVSVNGVTLASPSPETRALELDTIPSDMVSQIEVSKTLRPDMDADSIAGAVNIVTASPFDTDGFRFNGMIGASHNDFGGNDVRGNFLVSNIFSEGTFGAIFSASYSETDRKVDNIENVWERINRPEGGEVYGIIETLFKDYDTKRERMAFTGGLSFRPTYNDEFYLRGSYARFTDDEFRNRLRITWEDGTLQPGATDLSATFTNMRFDKQFRHRVLRNQLASFAMGGEHERENMNFDYVAAYSQGKNTYPNRDEIVWRSSLRPTISYDFSQDANIPAISLFNTNEHLQIATYSFRENTYREEFGDEDEYSLAVNVEIPSMFGATQNTWKFGAKWRSKDKIAEMARWRDRRAGSAPTEALSAFLTDVESTNYTFNLGNKVSPAMATDYFAAAKAGSTVDATLRFPDNITSNYEVKEDIYAGYGQSTMVFGDTQVVLGLRVENTRVDGTAPEFNADTNEVTVGVSRNRYTDLFPGINVRHAFSDDLIGRAAVTRAISRSNFRDIVPRVVAADTDSLRPRYTLGNPDLEPAMATNFDLGLEYYMMPLGLLSGHLFYKDLKDYHFTLATDGTFRGGPARLIQPQNAPDGYAYGLELSWNQQFENLPGWMSGFGMFANYTYTEAEMDLGMEYAGRSKFPLAGQSKNTYNTGVFYEKSGFNARLSYTDRSKYLIDVEAEDAGLDFYWAGRGQMDFTTSYSFMENWNVFLEAKNLTNTKGKRYQGSPDRTFEYEQFGYSVFAGLKFNY